MKSLKDYSLNITEAEYHAYPAWSHSLISRYAAEGFSSLATIHEPIKPSPSMAFGSLFDTIITRGEDFEKEYAVIDTCPPPAEKNVLDTLAELASGNFDLIPDSTIQEAISKCNYQGRLKYETQLAKLSTYKDYYNTISSGKTVVSSTDLNDAMEMAEALHNNEFSGKLFRHGEEDGIEYLYQLKFVVPATFANKHVEIKVMPDLVVVNHNDKTIQPVDLKTSSMPAHEWWDKNFIKYRYDIQAELYSDVIRVIKNKKDSALNDYSILPYIFTDISRTDKEPVSYVYDPTEPLSFGDYTYKGYRSLLSEMITYEEEHAKLPKYIKSTEANDIRALLNSKSK